jgi:UDP-N-acetylenolpyruvoylglucosamine reductase
LAKSRANQILLDFPDRIPGKLIEVARFQGRTIGQAPISQARAAVATKHETQKVTAFGSTWKG